MERFSTSELYIVPSYIAGGFCIPRMGRLDQFWGNVPINTYSPTSPQGLRATTDVVINTEMPMP